MGFVYMICSAVQYGTGIGYRYDDVIGRYLIYTLIGSGPIRTEPNRGRGVAALLRRVIARIIESPAHYSPYPYKVNQRVECCVRCYCTLLGHEHTCKTCPTSCNNTNTNRTRRRKPNNLSRSSHPDAKTHALANVTRKTISIVHIPTR